MLELSRIILFVLRTLIMNGVLTACVEESRDINPRCSNVGKHLEDLLRWYIPVLGAS